MKKMDYFLQDWRFRKVGPYIKDGDIVLDIGSFKGELFIKYSDKIKYGIGVEPLISEPLKGKNFTVYPGYFPENMPEKEQHVDIITMLAVLEHIPVNKQKALAESCAKWLKPGGLLLITVPSPSVDVLLHILTFLRLIDGMSLEEHFGFKTSDVPNIFAPPDFTLVKKRKFQVGLNNLYVLKRRS